MLWFAAGAQIMPLLVGLISSDGAWWAFAPPGACAVLAAAGFVRLPAAMTTPLDSLRRREGFLAVVLGWLIIVFITAVSYRLSGAFESFAECFFESMSGYTTMGATVANDIEALPTSVLFMRSQSHWIGGMGIIVLTVAILPELAVGGMQLFAAESTGLDAEKLAPRISATARRLWVIYVGITLAETLLLVVAGMSVFDAVNHAMSTIATGGFSTKNASIAAYDSLAIELIVLVFMFFAGISFTLQFRVFVNRNARPLLKNPEVRLYTALTLGAIVLLTIDTLARGPFDNLFVALRQASFQAVAIITTTGFGTADFDLWPELSRLVLVLLMFVGGCAGSTAGGFKVVRFYVVMEYAFVQLRRLVRPRLVQPLQLGERSISRETTEAILGFFLLYFIVLVACSLAMTALGLDIVSGTTASISALNSIGPGLGSVGAAENFDAVPEAGLYVLSFAMLLGRLEIYTVLVLFTRHFWRRG
ncbi:MAG: TrkH family potassium uptake protein [Deltaproteobacteria bacterium]|nr:TrkH family potassium uptake protein [Deltaproteobacteria bacterium]